MTSRSRHSRAAAWLPLPLFGIWPFLSFLDHNRDDALVYWADIAGYGIVFVGFLFAFAKLGRLLLGNDRSRSIVNTLGIGAVCFFSYLTIAGPLSNLGISLGSVKIAIWLAVSLAIMGVTWRISRRPNTTLVLGIAAAAMVIVPAARLALFAIEAEKSETYQETMVAATASDVARPNVYWIVLDAYSRNDVLEAYFGYRNDAFLSALRKRRFFIADKATRADSIYSGSYPAAAK